MWKYFKTYNTYYINVVGNSKKFSGIRNRKNFATFTPQASEKILMIAEPPEK